MHWHVTRWPYGFLVFQKTVFKRRSLSFFSPTFPYEFIVCSKVGLLKTLNFSKWIHQKIAWSHLYSNYYKEILTTWSDLHCWVIKLLTTKRYPQRVKIISDNYIFLFWYICISLNRHIAVQIWLFHIDIIG